MIRKRKNKLHIIKILLIFIPLLVLIMEQIIKINNTKREVKNINKYLEKTSVNENINKEKNDLSNYIAILEINEISLRKGLFYPQDKLNDVAYNVMILPPSKMPNISNSNLILAAHNGTSPVSYFKDLTRLKYGSLINIYYEGIKYIYKLHNIYEIPKTTKANIVRDITINTLTMITCKDNSDTEQVIYIAYLISKETY